MVDGVSECSSCLVVPPPYRKAQGALAYDDASKSLVLGFKHADKTHMVSQFLPWLMRVGAEMLSEADALVPVPLHYWRMVQRRYNQAAILAEALGREADVPVMSDLLLRDRATPVQGDLKPKARQENIKGAFAVPPDRRPALKGKRLILVDDVYTTGATVKECTRILLKAGAVQVDVLTLARVNKPDPILEGK